VIQKSSARKVAFRSMKALRIYGVIQLEKEVCVICSSLTKRGLKPMNSARSMPDVDMSGDRSCTMLLTPSTCTSQLDERVGR
jgi:hypothetical protein